MEITDVMAEIQAMLDQFEEDKEENFTSRYNDVCEQIRDLHEALIAYWQQEET